MRQEESSPPSQPQPARTPPQRQARFPPIFIYRAKDNFMHIQANTFIALFLSTQWHTVHMVLPRAFFT